MEETTPLKRCAKCHEYLERTAFNNNKRAGDGLGGRCRICDSEYKKEHRKKFPERHSAAKKARYERDREQILAQQKEYTHRPDVRERRLARNHENYWADPEKSRAELRARRVADPERIKGYKRTEYLRHGEKIRARMRAYYVADPERWKAQVLQWQRDNPERAAERTRRYQARKLNAAIGIVTVELLAGKAAYWGHRCWMCGGVPAAWDHVKPLNKKGPHMLANLRPACKSCNSSKSDKWPFPVLPGRLAKVG